jgi:hypothetical protein
MLAASTRRPLIAACMGAALASAACAGAIPVRPADADQGSVREAVGGAYVLADVDGRPLPARGRGENNVMLHAGTLALTPPDAAVLTISAQTADASALREHTVPGTWRLRGDSLMVDFGEGTMRGIAVGSVLRLTASDNSVITFRRR